MTTITERAKIGASVVKSAALPAGARELRILDTQLAGFRLRVFASGARSFEFRGRVKGGAERSVSLGDAALVSAASARAAAETLRVQFRAGVDPVAVAAAEVVAAQEAAAAEVVKQVTFGALAAIYLDRFVKGSLPHQGKVPTRRTAESEISDLARVRAVWGDLAVDGIDVLAAHELIDRLSPVAAETRKRSYGSARRVLDLAVSRGLVTMNPLRAVPSPKGSAERGRYLSRAEVGAVWTASRSLGRYGRLARFLIAMPVRLNVARFADWSEVDLDAATMRVPADRLGNKSRREWLLPLTPLAVVVLREDDARSGLIFHGDRDTPIAGGSRELARLHRASKTSGWTHHDFRRTASTLTGDAFAALDEGAFDLWLMHVRSGVHGVYQRSARLAAMREASGLWDKTLAAIVDGDAIIS